MEATATRAKIRWMLSMVVVILNVSNASGAVWCDVNAGTVTCNPYSVSSRPWTLCEILFPLQTSCPGDNPQANVTKLLLGSSGLNNVSKYALHRFPKLEVLDLRNNHLTSFPNSRRGWLSNSVLELYLSHNNLDTLPRYSFRGLANLAVLFLSNNQLSRLSAGTFAGNSELKLLDLSFNRLQTISSCAFQRLKRLIILNLNNNFLKTLSRTIFSDLVRLKVLNMKNNYLTVIPGMMLKPLRELETLKLKNNFLYELDISCLVSLHQITYLDVSANFLSFSNSTFFDGADLFRQRTMIISVSSKLKTLKISSAFKPSSTLPPFVEFRPSSNRIQSLDVSYTGFATCSLTFLGLERLTSLNISGGICGPISNIVFDYLPSLRNLSMSNMRMNTVQFRKHSGRLFNKLSRLENLDLSQNDMLSLHPGTLRFQLLLKTLNLAGNRFRSLPVELAHLHQLRVLDLSHNMLITLQPQERLTLGVRLGSPSLNLNNNPFSCSCSNAEFLHWWSATSVTLGGVFNDRSETRPGDGLKCVSDNGEVMSVAHVLENCAEESPGLFTAFTLLATLSPLLLVLVVMVITVIVKWRCCTRRSKRRRRYRKRMRARSTSFPGVWYTQHSSRVHGHRVSIISTDSEEPDDYPASKHKESEDFPASRQYIESDAYWTSSSIGGSPTTPNRRRHNTIQITAAVEPRLGSHPRFLQKFPSQTTDNTQLRPSQTTDNTQLHPSGANQPVQKCFRRVQKPSPLHPSRVTQKATRSPENPSSLISALSVQVDPVFNGNIYQNLQNSTDSETCLKHFASPNRHFEGRLRNYTEPLGMQQRSCTHGTHFKTCLTSASNSNDETQVKRTHLTEDDLRALRAALPDSATHANMMGFAELPRGTFSSCEEFCSSNENTPVLGVQNISLPSTENCPVLSVQSASCSSTENSFGLSVGNASDTTTVSLLSVQNGSNLSTQDWDLSLESITNPSSEDSPLLSFQTAPRHSTTSDSMLSFQTAPSSLAENSSTFSFQTASAENDSVQ